MTSRQTLMSATDSFFTRYICRYYMQWYYVAGWIILWSWCWAVCHWKWCELCFFCHQAKQCAYVLGVVVGHK